MITSLKLIVTLVAQPNKKPRMLNSQCVVMALVANKQKRITSIMTLELIVTIVQQHKLNKN
jgi:hypothetical protein